MILYHLITQFSQTNSQHFFVAVSIKILLNYMAL